MNQTNRADRYPSEEIRYPTRCSHDGCPDDIIPSANGVDCLCFKHTNYEDI
jgi:hypothetical protein